MANVQYADRVQETSTTSGTGTITLAGAVSGYRAFSSAFADGDTVRYLILDGTSWEAGEGVYSAGTLTRATVFASTNSNALVSFSGSSKAVWCNVPAAALKNLGAAASKAALYRDSSGNVAGSTVVSVDDAAQELQVVASAQATLVRVTNFAGSSVNGANFLSQKARGTSSSPTKALSGDQLGAFSARGRYEDAGGGYGPATAPAVRFVTEEDFTSTANGTSVVMFTTRKGTTSTAEAFRVSGYGLVTVTGRVASSGSVGMSLWTAAAHTAQTASTEVNDHLFDSSATLQFATGALATQRQFLVKARTYAAVASSTITTAATFAVDKAPVAGTNATITEAYAIWAQAGLNRFDGGISFAASAATTGKIRIEEADVDVIVGRLTGSDYAGVTYTPSASKWIFGNVAFYNVQNGFAVTLNSATTCASVDGTSGVTTDLCVVSQYLLADKQTTSSTGSTTNFTFAIAANEIWEVEFYGAVSCNNTGGVALGLDCPAGCTLEGQTFGCGASATAFNSVRMTAINTGYGVMANVNSATPKMATMKCLVTNGATAGTVTLRLYSVVNTQTSTMYAKSYFCARRVTGV